MPGKSYLAALDALHDAAIDLTVCRQEAGAAMMALTRGRLTGRPGICFVTRGPGATNAAHGVHIAEHDSAPMILFIGQVERGMLGRGAFQEMDYRAFFGSTAKWVTEIESARADPRNRRSAPFMSPCRGGPGPVVIALPEDMLTEMAAVARRPARRAAPIWPGPTQMAELAEDAVGRRAADRDPRRRRLDAGRPAPPSRASPNVSICLSRDRSAGRALFDGEHPQLRRRDRPLGPIRS